MPPKRPNAATGQGSLDTHIVPGQPNLDPADRREAAENAVQAVEGSIFVQNIWREHQRVTNAAIQQNANVQRETAEYIEDNKERLERGRYAMIPPSGDGIVEALQHCSAAQALQRDLELVTTSLEEERARHSKTQEGYENIITSMRNGALSSQDLNDVLATQKRGMNSLKLDIQRRHDVTACNLEQVRDSLIEAQDESKKAYAEGVRYTLDKIGKTSMDAGVLAEFQRREKELTRKLMSAEQKTRTIEQGAIHAHSAMETAVALKGAADNERIVARAKMTYAEVALETHQTLAKKAVDALTTKHDAAIAKNEHQIAQLTSELQAYESAKIAALQAEHVTQSAINQELVTTAQLQQELAAAREESKLLQSRIDRKEWSGERKLASQEVDLQKHETRHAQHDAEQLIWKQSMSDTVRMLNEARLERDQLQSRGDNSFDVFELNAAKNEAYTQALTKIKQEFQTDSDSKRTAIAARHTEVVNLTEQKNRLEADLDKSKLDLQAVKNDQFGEMKNLRAQWTNGNDQLMKAHEVVVSTLKTQLTAADTHRDEAVSETAKVRDEFAEKELQLGEEITGLKEQITGLKEQITGLNEQITSLDTQLAASESAVKGLKAEKTKQEADAQSSETKLRQEIERLKNEIQTAHETNERLWKDKDTKDKDELAWLNTYADEHKEQIDKLTKHKDTAIQAAGEAIGEANRIRLENEKLEKKNGELSDSVTRWKTLAESTANNASEAHAKQASVQSGLSESVKTLESQVTRLQTKLTAAEQLSGSRAIAIHAYEDEIEELNEKADQVNQQLKECKAHAAGAGTEMVALREKILHSDIANRDRIVKLKAGQNYFLKQATENSSASQLLRNDLVDLRGAMLNQQDLVTKLNAALSARRAMEVARNGLRDRLAQCTTRLQFAETSQRHALEETRQTLDAFRELQFDVRDAKSRRDEVVERYDKRVLQQVKLEGEIREFTLREYKLKKRATLAEDAWRKNKMTADVLYKKWMEQRQLAIQLGNLAVRVLGDNFVPPPRGQLPEGYVAFATEVPIDFHDTVIPQN
nr:hypothetical protein B0A51_02208 [Rachicladosporium sp. CCFEE 5018]